MKNKIIYIAVFTAAFIFTTGGIIFLNSSFKNIFQFDFSPPAEVITINEKRILEPGINIDSLKSQIISELKSELLDSLISANTIKKNSPFIAKNDSVQTVKNNIDDSATKNLLSQNEKKPVIPKEIIEEELKESKLIQPDSGYVKWTKTTARLYESMEPSKAAKIIMNYSDNIARDIIYSMKKKKAAEILSYFHPETANRITRAKDGL